mmetsp:Transcript_387/g.514  ORF Transcript_387/g.514 Transcript_387/m.514 type:complete len:222 (+) Transcript_387:259-924(+)
MQHAVHWRPSNHEQHHGSAAEHGWLRALADVLFNVEREQQHHSYCIAGHLFANHGPNDVRQLHIFWNHVRRRWKPDLHHLHNCGHEHIHQHFVLLQSHWEQHDGDSAHDYEYHHHPHGCFQPVPAGWVRCWWRLTSGISGLRSCFQRPWFFETQNGAAAPDRGQHHRMRYAVESECADRAPRPCPPANRPDDYEPRRDGLWQFHRGNDRRQWGVPVHRHVL